MKIATWNVNSVKARLPHLLAWLRQTQPDVLLLQETKVTDESFPALEIGDLGYTVETVGQKSYNGVAVLSRGPLDVCGRVLLGIDGLADSDSQARYLDASVQGLRVISVYVPNGNPVDSEKFAYKLAFLERLYAQTRRLLASEVPFVLAGDFNIAPENADVYDPVGWRNDALCRPESRAAFHKLMYLGLTDGLKAVHAQPGFTWWDYRAGAFAADHGLRIDHLLLSPQAADRLLDAGVDRLPRGWERPSDHAPVWCELAPA
ncbi:MAG: exodeoxyribonuclease III [Defluviicoccus sp.]|nr:MAG: exodeoxyribonuclease III [Defluviicoccus sp.]